MGLHLSQERIVFAIAVLLFVGFSGLVPRFLSAGNILSLVQNVSILGILGVGMAQATDITYLSPSAGWLKALGGSTALGIPSPIVVFAAVCLAAYLFLRFTKWGRFIYTMGDNPLTARVTGILTRPMMLLQYALAGLVAHLAGLVTAAVANSMSTRVVGSTLVYDVILVALIGGSGSAAARAACAT